MMLPTPPTAIEPTIVTDIYELARLLMKRRRELGYSQLEFDQVAGLSDGHTAKIEAGYRGLGQVSLPLILGALGVDLRIELVPRDGSKVRESFSQKTDLGRFGVRRFRPESTSAIDRASREDMV